MCLERFGIWGGWRRGDDLLRFVCLLSLCCVLYRERVANDRTQVYIRIMLLWLQPKVIAPYVQKKNLGTNIQGECTCLYRAAAMCLYSFGEQIHNAYDVDGGLVCGC